MAELPNKKPEEKISKVAGVASLDSVPPPAAPPPGWQPLLDQDGSQVRIYLSPTPTEDDMGWLGDAAAAGKLTPTNLFRMPGDEIRGGYIATPPPPVPPQVPLEGEGGYWSEVAKNAPGSAFGLAQGVASAVQPFTNVTQGMQLAHELATNPEFRSEVATYYKNFISAEGWAENFKKDPFGFSFDVLGTLMPIKKTPKVPKPVTLPKMRILTADELKQMGGSSINLAKNSGVYFLDDFVINLQEGMKGGEKAQKFRPGREGASDINDIMKDIDALSETSVTFAELQDLNELLGSAWMKAKRRGDNYHAAVAAEMKQTLNKFVDQVDKAKGEGLVATHDMTPERAAEVYLEGRQMYRQAMFAKELEAMGKMAEVDAYQFAQSGEANALRKYVRQLLRRHYRIGDTGMKPTEVAALEDFAKIGWKDKFLKVISRKVTTITGALIGQSVDQLTGLPGVGTAVGAFAAGAAQEGAKAAMDLRAVQQFNRFRESVLANGSKRLQGLIGEAVYERLYGSAESAKAADGWLKSIGTHGFNQASKGLAVAIASAARLESKEAIDEIYARLIKVEDQVAMDVEAEDENATAPAKQ